MKHIRLLAVAAVAVALIVAAQGNLRASEKMKFSLTIYNNSSVTFNNKEGVGPYIVSGKITGNMPSSIPPGYSGVAFRASGTEGSAVGTEGEIAMYDDNRRNLIVVNWSVPYSGSNTYSADCTCNDVQVEQSTPVTSGDQLPATMTITDIPIATKQVMTPGASSGPSPEWLNYQRLLFTWMATELHNLSAWMAAEMQSTADVRTKPRGFTTPPPVRPTGR
jgi:hypothetical protein